MKTKIFFSLLLVSSLVMTSCKKELEPQESSSTTEAATPTAGTANPNTAPAVTPTQMPQSTAAVSPAPPTNTAKGMNPAHGQPGHRCDIPVGAPLNSPPGKTPSPQATTQMKQSENTPVTLKPAAINSDGKITPASNYTTSGTPAILNTPAAATAPGMNPPHGQAGHRCEVAVGAPLPK